MNCRACVRACVCAYGSLSSALDGLRLDADSYTDQTYFAHAVHRWTDSDGRVRLARFRAVPADGRAETGRLAPHQHDRVWNYLSVAAAAACNSLLPHTRLTALCPGLPGSAGTRKVKPIWILLEQETVSGSGISWTVCKSALHSRQITTQAPHHSSFLQAGCPSCRPANSVKALKGLSSAPVPD